MMGAALQIGCLAFLKLRLPYLKGHLWFSFIFRST